jgi:hypothetical protein
MSDLQTAVAAERAAIAAAIRKIPFGDIARTLCAWAMTEGELPPLQQFIEAEKAAAAAAEEERQKWKPYPCTGYQQATLPAGSYYVGDICYVLDDEDLVDDADGFYTDGTHVFGSFLTAGGDGYFTDTLGHGYGVDAGNISIVPLAIIDEKHKKSVGLGHVFTFANEFQFGCDENNCFWASDPANPANCFKLPTKSYEQMKTGPEKGITLPAGTYYVGDSAGALPEDSEGYDDGFYTNGSMTFGVFSAGWGDHVDIKGRKYFLDNHEICIVAQNVINPKEMPRLQACGQMLTFENEFQVGWTPVGNSFWVKDTVKPENSFEICLDETEEDEEDSE